MGAESSPLSLFGGGKRPRNSKMAPFCAPFFEIWNLNKITMKSEHKKWWQKAPPHIINKGFKEKLVYNGKYLTDKIAEAASNMC